MTAQIVGTEIKLIWRLFVHHYNPVRVANTILHRMQVSLVWVRAQSVSLLFPHVVASVPYLNACGGHNEDSYRLCFQIDVLATCTSLL